MSTCFTLCRRLHELQRNWSRASELLQKRLSTSEGRDCLNAQAQTHHGGDLDEAREHMFKSLQQEVIGFVLCYTGFAARDHALPPQILDGNDGEVWTPPESFERKTTK